MWAGSILSWTMDGESRQAEFRHNVASALALRSGGIAVVEESGREAWAVILNSDGTLRVFLRNPFGREQGLVFYYFRYDGAELVVIFAGATGDLACRVDEVTGELSAPRETR
jgi:hypothetical protein